MFRAPPLPRTLEAALRDAVEEKPAVRVDAISDLVAHADDSRERVLGALDKALSDGDARVRAAALRALGAIGAHEVLPALLVACEDDDATVRQEAIAALGEVGDERACGKLERALVDGRPEVRFQAVMAYPRVCSTRDDVVAVLERATRDADQHVVHVALRMAEEIGGAPSRTASLEADDAMILAEEEDEDGASVAPPSLLERARSLLTHEAPRVRAVAAVVLARAGDAGGDAVIVGVVDGSVATPEAEDVSSAIELAGRRGLTRATSALERRAFGGLLGFGRDAWSWHARTALARLGHARARHEILRELDAGDRTRATLAVVAAGRARLVDARPALLRLRSAPRGVDPSVVARALDAIARVEAPPEAGSGEGGTR